jgi:hypothetical protein
LIPVQAKPQTQFPEPFFHQPAGLQGTWWKIQYPQGYWKEIPFVLIADIYRRKSLGTKICKKAGKRRNAQGKRIKILRLSPAVD